MSKVFLSIRLQFMYVCRRNLSSSEMKLRDVNEKIANGTGRIQNVNTDIQDLRDRLRDLTKDAINLQDNATALQEANVEGMYTILNLLCKWLVRDHPVDRRHYKLDILSVAQMFWRIERQQKY